MAIDMNQILSAKFGESDSTIRAAFKKTVYIKKFETEVIELESTLNILRPMDAGERARTAALMQAQLEYAAFAGLVYKEQVTPAVFNERKAAMEREVSTFMVNTDGTAINMDQILAMKLGEATSQLRTVFKKTVKVGEFETEVVELESSLDVNSEITNSERVFLTSVLRAQLEYTAFENLKEKAMITEGEVTTRKACLEQEVNSVKMKAEGMTGQSMDKYM